MTPALTGGLIGGALGLVNFFVLNSTAQKMERKKSGSQDSQGAKVLRLVAWADLVIFPLIGYFVGPLLLS